MERVIGSSAEGREAGGSRGSGDLRTSGKHAEKAKRKRSGDGTRPSVRAARSCHAVHGTMYYYSRRAEMSSSGPGLRGCGGGGGGGGGACEGEGGGERGCCGRLVNGAGGPEREVGAAEAREKTREDVAPENGAGAGADVTPEGGESAGERCCCGLVGIDHVEGLVMRTRTVSVGWKENPRMVILSVV